MADKVRVLIETLKNDILYFVRKGVFSKEDVKLIMKQREVNGNFQIKRIYFMQKKCFIIWTSKSHSIWNWFRKKKNREI